MRNNRRTKRLVVVVCTSPLLVLYLATFNKSTTLPNTLPDKSVWYPVGEAQPSGCVSCYPLETEPKQNFAQWVNMRRLYTVNDLVVRLLPSFHLAVMIQTHPMIQVQRIGGFHFPEQAIVNLMEALIQRMVRILTLQVSSPSSQH